MIKAESGKKAKSRVPHKKDKGERIRDETIT
jgi:hypothetical protein